MELKKIMHKRHDSVVMSLSHADAVVNYSCTVGVSFYYCLCIWYLQLRHISVHTYVQCAAVRTHSELMREPPQK